MGRSRERLLSVAVVTATVAIFFVLTELGFRAYLFGLYVVTQKFPIVTMDVRPFNQIGAMPGTLYGYYQPHKPITFTSYDEYGNVLQSHTTPINNFGWPSEYDYARAKGPREYRIAIVGDSMTASINNAKPWPDALQRQLNADPELLAAVNADRITVLNMGAAGARLQFMANPLTRIAIRCSPDLLPATGSTAPAVSAGLTLAGASSAGQRSRSCRRPGFYRLATGPSTASPTISTSLRSFMSPFREHPREPPPPSDMHFRGRGQARNA